MLKRLLLIGLAGAIAAGMAYADQARTKVIIPVSKTSPTSGKQMFANYCAPCHGVDARGNGPAAAALKMRPDRSDRNVQEEPWKIPRHSYRLGIAVWRRGAGTRIGGDARMGSDPW